MTLSDELQKARKEIKTDSYPITIRELASLYKERELDIHPEFQRFLRWSDEQKTKLIESIFLGIPLPSVFLYQRDDGVLDVVDGLQRISTILHFMGELYDEEGQLVRPLILGPAEYLPSLEGKSWHGAEGSESISSELQRFFRTEKIDVKLLLRDSDQQAKYELFQRLNTGGTPLSDQEVRNCILIMVNRDAYFWLEGLTKVEDFEICCPMPDRLILERYNIELALRFVVLHDIDLSEISEVDDLSRFLTDRMVTHLGEGSANITEIERVFRRTFSALSEAHLDNALRKYNSERGRFTGPFLISAFEMVALGVAFNIDYVEDNGRDWLEKKIRGIWLDPRSEGIYGQGVSTARRLPKTLSFGREYFGEP